MNFFLILPDPIYILNYRFTCATMLDTSPVLAGNISVLFVLASSPNAPTYFSATARAAAFCPFSPHKAAETSSMD